VLGAEADSCSVVVAECAHVHADPARDPLHPSPASLAAMAAAAAPDLLVATHLYPPRRRGEAVAAVRAGYGGPVIAGADGPRVRLGAGDFAVAPPAAAV
jgi:ribonuclease BN (tRNA processing enzyme)